MSVGQISSLMHFGSKVFVLGCRTVLLPMSIRSKLLKIVGMTIGKECRLRHGVVFGSRSRIRIGNDVGINIGSYLDGSDNVIIEDGVSIGPGVLIVTGSHKVGPSHRRCYGNITKPVHIKLGSWLNAGCIINPGVTIAEGCVIGSGAVVTKDTKPNGFYVGNPAKRIRDIDEDGNMTPVINNEEDE